MNNQNLGSDALSFLDELIPDTPETRLAERQEIFRIALTQAMKDIRKKMGLTQQEIAEKLNVDKNFVAELESANNDHTFESVLAYLSILNANLEVNIILKDEKVKVLAAKIDGNQDEINAAIDPIWESVDNIKSTKNPFAA